MTIHAQRRYLLLIVGAYLLLAIAYALATPPLEASDEYKHYPVVQHIQTQRELPILDPEDPGRWLQEAAQPPLYYILMAGITAWIDTSDLEEVHQVNPHAFVGNPNQLGNKNLIIHQPEQETFPWRGSVLAVYVIRLASILIGAGTILLTARLGGLLFDPQVSLLAAALLAFNPMFIFVNAAVNNDALAIFLAHLGLFLLVRIWREAPDPRQHWPRYAVLGLVLGLGILTKLSVGGLLFLAGIALAWLAWRRRQWRYLFLGGGLVLIVSLLVLLPWLLRNLNAYGDPTGLDVFIQVQDSRDKPLTIARWRGEFGTLYRSFWGLFGGVNVAAPEWVYWLYNLLAIVGLAGFIYWGWSQWRAVRDNEDTGATSPARPGYDGLWLLLAWPLILLILLIRWNIFSPAFQGRLLFPALGAITVVWAVGLLALVRPSLKPRVALGIGLVALAIAALLPWLSIRPAYAYPEPLASVPESARFGPITFQAGGGVLQLAGVEVPAEQTTTPGGEPIEVSLYWQALEPVGQDYLSNVHILGRGTTSVGQVNRYPGGGMIPTSMWQSGQIWRDVYRVNVSRDAQAPARLQIKTGLYDTESKQDLIAIGPGQQTIELLLVGEARLASDDGRFEPPTNELNVGFAEGVVLKGYDLSTDADGQMIVDLHWSASDRPAADYTVFVHLLDAAGNQVAGGDGPPVYGDYPTGMWRKGDVIIDEHRLILPADMAPGDYQLAVGLYDPLTLARLARLDGQGDTVRWPVAIDGES
jgi:4-amino-4-deoxy-L-arabinose transferase-like glycosyltransferase